MKEERRKIIRERLKLIRKKIPIGTSTGLNSSGANNVISKNALLSGIQKNTGNNGCGGGNNKLLLEYITNNDNKILPLIEKLIKRSNNNNIPTQKRI